MNAEHDLSRVRGLSDAELLSSLSGLVRLDRKLVADVVAHLAEVEERRLHLIGGYSSLFAYCVSRLGMTEDEAYRRIHVARLARLAPPLLERLASGRLSLSVAALLQPYLAKSRHLELLDALSGKTIRQAREVLACWFPKPDVLPAIRKLPSRCPVADASVTPSTGQPHPTPAPRTREPALALTTTPAAAPTAPAWPPTAPPPPPLAPPAIPRGPGATLPDSTLPPRPHDAMTPALAIPSPPTPPPATRRSCIEPLSPGRYKVQLTADAQLKRKLELARDLLRHAIPHGDLAALIERALDLLLDNTLRRRFGLRRSDANTASLLSAPLTPFDPHAAPGATTPQRPAVDPLASTPDDTPNGAQRQQPLRFHDPAHPLGSPDVADAAFDHLIDPTTRADCPRMPATDRDHAAPCSEHTDAPITPVATARDEGLGAARPPTATTPSMPSSPPPSSPPPSSPPRPARRHIPNAVRRAVLAHDEARCSWRGPDGERCNSRAWLEHDHILPRALRGNDDPDNLRLLCRPHNRLAAELAYGRPTIDRAIDRRRARQMRRLHPEP